MHVVLLVIGLASVLVGVGLAYGGYVNFDFRYCGTLGFVAALTIFGGLVLVGLPAVIGQLKRMRGAFDIAQSAFPGSAAGRHSDLEPPEPDDHRLPVLPPRPARPRPSDTDS